MDGVQILNQFEVVIETALNSHVLLAGIITGILIALISGIVFELGYNDWKMFWIVFGVVAMVLSPIIGLSGAKRFSESKVETHYEVSINEKVNMAEFMDKYEILETRGAIYTVREKN